MKRFQFPIAEVNDYQLTSIYGDYSYFYEVDGVDFEQLNDLERDNFFNGLKEKLSTLEKHDWLKLYRLSNRLFINTSNIDQILGLDVKKCRNPLETFFENSDIYSDIGIYDDYLLFNGKYRRVISTKSFSDKPIDEYFLPSNIDYCLSFKKKSKSKDLERVRNAHRAGLAKSKRDFESEGAYSQAEDLINELTNGSESLFEMELFFLPSSTSLEELNRVSFNLIESLSIKGVETFIEGNSFKELKTGLYDIYKEIIVGVKPSFSFRSIPNRAGHLKYLIPLSESFLMNDGIEFLDIHGKSIFFNPFSNSFKNRNMLVSGMSGAGKSVFINKVVHHLATDHPTVILDKGGSFKKTCLYHNGNYLSAGISPMSFRCSYFLREFILSVVDKSHFDKLKRGLLLKRIKEYLHDGESSFYLMLKYLEKDFKDISLYFEDLKDFIVDDPESISDFLYVDIEKYPKSQITPLIIYVLEYFKRIPKNKKVLVFDECWSFLKDHSEYIDECFRTFRKVGVFTIAISQGLRDFENLSENLYSSIINNSYFRVFFPQESVVGNDVTDFDNGRIKDLQFEKGAYSECYLKTSDNKIKKILRLMLSPLEYELYHTEAGQSENLFKYFEENRKYFSTNHQTIESFVRLHHG